jgi:hydrogenase nickel incorporation protein HypA/HybF
MVQALLTQVEVLMREHRAGRVVAIHVGVGLLSGVDPDLFRSAYSDLVGASCVRGAELHITPIPLEPQCSQCRTRLLPAKFRFVCPSCGSDRVVVLRGEGLILERVTLEETEPQSHP